MLKRGGVFKHVYLYICTHICVFSYKLHSSLGPKQFSKLMLVNCFGLCVAVVQLLVVISFLSSRHAYLCDLAFSHITIITPFRMARWRVPEHVCSAVKFFVKTIVTCSTYLGTCLHQPNIKHQKNKINKTNKIKCVHLVHVASRYFTGS